SLLQLTRSATNMASAALGTNVPGGLTLGDTISGDTKIHYVTLPMVRPAWAVKQGVLYAGFYPQVVAAAASGVGQQSILDNANFAAMRTKLAGSHQAKSLRYMDLEKTTPAVYPAWLFVFGYSGFVDIFYSQTPPMILPPLSELVKNAGPAAQLSWVDDAGWHMNAISPFPGSTIIGNDPTFVATAPLGLSVLLPSLNRARETANRVKCASNERQIGQAILLYANENKGKYPPDLGALVKTQDIAIECFVCPTSNASIPAAIRTFNQDTLAAWVNANSYYVYG